jgi:general stress protein YciG
MKRLNIEASRRGGIRTKEERGTEHFRAIGKRGGEAVLERHGKAFLKEIGNKGGQTVASRPGHMAAVGARGGAVSSERLGPDGRSALGKSGARGMAQKREILAALEPFRPWLERCVAELTKYTGASAGAVEKMAVTTAGMANPPTIANAARLLKAIGGTTEGGEP